MATNVQIIAAGANSPVLAVTPAQSIMGGTSALGGTITVFTGPTPNGPWIAWSSGASGSTASIRTLVNSYCYATAGTSAGVLAISDISAGQGSNPLDEPIVNCNAVLASANVTTETILASWRVPPQFLKPNFRMRARATASDRKSVV